MNPLPSFLGEFAAFLGTFFETRPEDPELQKFVTSQQNLTFYWSTKLEYAAFLWFFSINDSYASWESDGIIALLVYASRLAASTPRQVISKAAGKASHSEVCAETAAWLEERTFPAPLVSCFTGLIDL